MIGLLLAVTLAATQVAGQDPTPATIDSGMSRAQVVAKLGEPMSSRTYDGHTYLLYKNGCERSCGMSDLVVLDSDKVVDAIFRSSARRYSGTSSSPRMISMANARVGSDKGEKVAKADKIEKPAKAAKVAKVDSPQIDAQKGAKVEKVEGGETAPAKPAAKPAAPKKGAAKDTIRKDTTSKKSQPAKKPAS
jgi:outer membrane protein assembly factor BamE (lipoprotein component of BamABCDE complex)